METNKNITSISLKEYAEESYLNYAMYVILDRALPHVGDAFPNTISINFGLGLF